MAANAVKRLVPLFDRILIKKADPITQTKGGIMIPETSRGKMLKGTVIAVGPGSRNTQGEHVPPTVKVGDNVLLPEFGGTKVEFDENSEYHLFRETDILAKVEE
ncbi:hypothetical protein PPYR_08991 [Photinus pyralis]|uniref:10 kDa heat shock protein, mitochondrial n=1 Tax=Photinus pyralis TaxID=7054 RepID=A0A1Y1LM22_PHOPY|nr:10 kDa heat shock protein, mitochondrial [Photinus pyralis]KAB0797998.1 hypothetical protein PPYR_08991 [Photinus pyralis]